MSPVAAEPRPSRQSSPESRPRRPERLRALSWRNISAVYVGILLFAIFAVVVPSTFLTKNDFETILDEQAVNGLIAVGLVIPLAAGAYDLSIGANLGLGAILVAWLNGQHHLGVGLSVALTILACAGVGGINGFLVSAVGLDSFIATLAVSSCLSALVVWISNSQDIIGLSPGMMKLGSGELLGIQYPFYYMLVIAFVLWYLLEFTPVGRYLYATGGSLEAARLAGLPTKRLIFGALVIGGMIAGIAGLLETASVGAGSPDIGPTYLLSAFSAAFLGATQLRRGRVNIWGTLIAVYVLAVGVKGLELAGAPSWLPDMFNGVALIVAVTLARAERKRMRRPDLAAADGAAVVGPNIAGATASEQVSAGVGGSGPEIDFDRDRET